jgi:hypothetical protein
MVFRNAYPGCSRPFPTLQTDRFCAGSLNRLPHPFVILDKPALARILKATVVPDKAGIVPDECFCPFWGFPRPARIFTRFCSEEA